MDRAFTKQVRSLL